MSDPKAPAPDKREPRPKKREVNGWLVLDKGVGMTSTHAVAVVKRAFNAKKARKFLQKQVHHISANREMAEGIRFLFDDQGRPPPNASLEDIIEERRKIDYQIVWLEAVLSELRHRLIKIREVEDYALEMLSRALPEE